MQNVQLLFLSSRLGILIFLDVVSGTFYGVVSRYILSIGDQLTGALHPCFLIDPRHDVVDDLDHILNVSWINLSCLKLGAIDVVVDTVVLQVSVLVFNWCPTLMIHNVFCIGENSSHLMLALDLFIHQKLIVN